MTDKDNVSGAHLVLLLRAASGYEARHEYGNITPSQWGDILRVCEGKLSSAAQVPAAEVRAQALAAAEEAADDAYLNAQCSIERGEFSQPIRQTREAITAAIRNLAQSSTADKATEVRAAVQKLFDAVEKGAAPFKVEYALDQLEGDEVQLGIDPGYVRDIFTAAGLIAAPSTADSGNTDEKGDGK